MTVHKAAQALGRRARGKPKTLTLAERARRSAWMREVNHRRRLVNKPCAITPR